MSTTTATAPFGLKTHAVAPRQLRQRLSRWLGLAPARPLTRSEEAAVVRAMAVRLHDSEAGFASDLYAAADRHEQIG